MDSTGVDPGAARFAIALDDPTKSIIQKSDVRGKASRSSGRLWAEVLKCGMHRRRARPSPGAGSTRSGPCEIGRACARAVAPVEPALAQPARAVAPAPDPRTAQSPGSPRGAQLQRRARAVAHHSAKVTRCGRATVLYGQDSPSDLWSALPDARYACLPPDPSLNQPQSAIASPAPRHHERATERST